MTKTSVWPPSPKLLQRWWVQSNLQKHNFMNPSGVWQPPWVGDQARGRWLRWHHPHWLRPYELPRATWTCRLLSQRWIEPGLWENVIWSSKSKSLTITITIIRKHHYELHHLHQCAVFVFHCCQIICFPLWCPIIPIVLFYIAVANCPWCQIVLFLHCRSKLSWFQIVLFYTAVLNCPGAKLSYFTLSC